MLLFPAIHAISSAVTRVYYRVTRSGDTVPRTGPALLVANHNNSLLDPAMVIVGAGRPVRFLAKAPLLDDRAVGWLVRGAGSIPVYRRHDDPALMERNLGTFSAAHDALAGGSAIGIFPEGISHDEPSLSPLKTGAARIALGAAARIGRAFPIVPIGLVFREKDIFRSEALIISGEPIAWDDLSGQGESPETVRELTARIDRALRAVTVNLERWEDAPLVDGAEAIWSAEHEASAHPADRLARIRETTESLARLRQSGDPAWEPLARDIRRHLRILRRLRLAPREVHADASLAIAARWSVRQLPYVGALAWLALGAGALLWAVPYRLTGPLARRTSERPDTTSTYKAMYGTVLFAGWWILLVVAAGLVRGLAAGLVVAVAAPLLGLSTLALSERLDEAWGDVRRFFLRRRRREIILELRDRQRALATRLDALRVSVSSSPGAPAPTQGQRVAAVPRGSGSGSSAIT